MKWNKKGLIYNTKGTESWSISHAQVPIVDQLDKKIWRIYYSTRNRQNHSNISFIDVEARSPKDIIYVHNKPILSKGKIGCFDDSGVMPTCIINHNGKKYLYYIGWTTGKTVPYRNSIGLAISENNGFTFERYAEGPIITSSLYDTSFTGTIFILKEKGIFHGLYLSCSEWQTFNGKIEPIYNIKYTSSIDGVNWERDGVVAIPLQNDEGGIASASIIKINGKYKMWYSVRKSFEYRTNIQNTYRIGYAESNDIINWVRKDKEAGIELSQHGWDSEMLAYPNVLKSKTKIYMFYNGNGFGKSGFGYAEKEYKNG